MMKMIHSSRKRIHFLQHIPEEDPAHLFSWAKTRDIELTGTRLYHTPQMPDPTILEGLIVMGGTMGVYDLPLYPWLKQEKKYIEKSLHSGCRVLGICLGAQLIADVLGARVVPNKTREIGWYPVALTPEGHADNRFLLFPEKFMAFHWHGDTFDLPSGTIHLAESEACRHQAFSYYKNVLGLQFHLEMTPEILNKLLEQFAGQLTPGPHVQSAEEIRRLMHTMYTETIRLCNLFMDQWLGK